MLADRRRFSFAFDGRKATLKRVHRASESYELSVDGVAQSVVSLTDARRLAWPYVQHIARAIDAVAAPGAPVFAVHLGAGAMALTRYVAVTRPGSPQLVVEFERELCEAVLAALPLPDAADIELVFGDARAIAETGVAETGVAAAGVAGAGSAAIREWQGAEVTVVDLWDAATIRAHVASLEFYRLVAERSAPQGLVAVNLLDGHPFDYARAQAATLRKVFADVAVITDFDPADTEGPLGNVVVLASGGAVAVAEHPELFGDEPPFVLHDADLTAWIAEAGVLTDADRIDSPDIDDPRWA
ncbi:spermine synthase [Herbiconiux sp. CPCC 205716]|uniref:Spermine synthase n=1 Tax=Herbiconiux gentiana TaxID=2970912 RepID=A0ABT2GE99_9MICO|nr:spermine synthase [Herbiconiux gentiana]MCS5714503.1 spermine synthase [Herbiconiux gentiana]